MLVLDDLHAADEPSLLLLRFLARGLSSSRLLVVGAYRDVDPTPRDPLASTLAELATGPGTHRIELGGLDEPDVSSYIYMTTGIEADLATVAEIHAQTEGNALFVEEVTRLLVAEDALDDGGAADVGIPAGVREVIGRRLRRLSEQCRQALTIASVLGREFAIITLGQMIECEPPATLELLDEALEARVVGEVPGAPGRLRFSHALVRETLYDGLTPARRLRLHAQAGEAMEVLHSDNEEPHLAELAHHFVEAAAAGNAARAVEFARRAGDRAAALLAHEEAARLYGMAIDVLELPARVTGQFAATCCWLWVTPRPGAALSAPLRRPLSRPPRLLERSMLPTSSPAPPWATAGVSLVPGGKGSATDNPARGRPRRQPRRDSGLRAMLLARLAGALRDRPVPERRAVLTEEAVEIAARLGNRKRSPTRSREPTRRFPGPGTQTDGCPWPGS